MASVHHLYELLLQRRRGNADIIVRPSEYLKKIEKLLKAIANNYRRHDDGEILVE